MRPPKKPKHAVPPAPPPRPLTGEAELDEIIEDYERKPRPSLSSLLADRVKSRADRAERTSKTAGIRKESSARLSLTDRRNEKERAARRRRLKIAGISALIVALLAGAAYLLFYSPVFAVKAAHVSVEVRDEAGIIDDTAIVSLAHSEVGTPVLRVDAGRLERELEDLPEVSEASVSASFPSSLTVHVTADTPIACIGTAGECTPVLADGTEVPSVSPEVAAQLPVVSMSLNDETERRLQGVLDAVGALPEQIRSQVTSATMSDSGLVELSLPESTVKWGEPVDHEKKARVLEVLMTSPAGTYDVSTPDSPVTY